MDNKSNRKHGAAISMANMVVSLLIGVLYTPFALRFLGKSEYGIFTLSNSLIAYLAMLDLGFGNTLVRYNARARAEGKDEKNINGMFLIFYSVISFIALIVGIFMLFNVERFFSTSFTDAEVKTLKTVFAIMLATTVISFPTSVFSSLIRAHEKFIFANTLNLLRNVLYHVVALSFMYFGYKSVALAWISFATSVVVILINIYYAFSKLHIRFGFEKFEKKFYSEIFSYSFFILINIIVDQLYANTDNIILGKVCGSAAVAIYGVGMLFQTYFAQFSVSISGVFLPHISQIVTKDDGMEETSNIFVKIGHSQFVMLSFILTGFIVFGKEFISLWAGKGYDAAYYIALLVLVPTIIPLSQNIGISILQALNKHKTRSMMYFCIAIINVLLSIPLAKIYGGIGAAMGTAIGNILGQIIFMNWYYYKKIGIDIPLYWKQVLLIGLKTIPVAGIFILVNYFLPAAGWNLFAIKVALSIFIVAPYYYFVIMNFYEKSLINSMFKKLKYKGCGANAEKIV